MNRTKYALSTDCVVFGYAEGELKIALIKRKNAPFKGRWAIPGGFVEGNETVEQGARRELEEETGIRDIYLEQFHVFSDPKRDPRGRVITVAFFALVNSEQFHLVATNDALDAKWWPAYETPKLAFDHQKIYEMALDRLRWAIEKDPIAFELLPEQFTLTEMQRLYEQILGEELDKRNFRKKVNSLPYIRPTGSLTKGVSNRPAKLYKFQKGGKK